MKTKNMQFKLFRPITLVVLLMGLTFFSQVSPLAEASSVRDLREKSVRLQKEIENANEKADNLHAEAESLRGAISKIDSQIAQTQRRIDLLDNKIAILDERLKRAEAELERQKELLRASMRALYKRGDASAMELLIASENFGEFMDEQEYLDRLKGAIHESANRVVELQQQIQTEKNEQEKLKKEQEAARRALDQTRAQRQQLLDETQGQEARFRDIIARNKEELEEAERELTRRLAAGQFVSIGPVSRGDAVGRLGNTGSKSTGAHLHLEARNTSPDLCASREDPNPFIDNGTWRRPLDQPYRDGLGYGATSTYYDYACGFHPGNDYISYPGHVVRAVADGEIVIRGCSQDYGLGSGYGYMVMIKHANGIYSMYAHMLPPNGGGYSHCS